MLKKKGEEGETREIIGEEGGRQTDRQRDRQTDREREVLIDMICNLVDHFEQLIQKGAEILSRKQKATMFLPGYYYQSTGLRR